MRLYCPVCNKEFPLDIKDLACPESSDDGVHPLIKLEDADELSRVFPTILTKRWNEGKLSFSVFREFMASYQLANEHGKASWWLERVLALSNACERLTGRGFVRTPEIQADELAEAIDLPKGSLFVKNETLQLMGSHKSRHLAGAIMHLETLREISGEDQDKKTLAIFSCGNAAMGAAAIAGAAGYQLYAFVPDHVSDTVVAILTNLGTNVVKVSRDGNVGEGDPCNLRYQEALKKFGWVPFTSYGHDIWSAVEGAETLAYEFFFNQYLNDAALDVMVIQVGGGGLANAVISGAQICKRLGMIRKLPRFYTCQTSSCYPLAQSYFMVLRELGRDGVVTLPPELSMALESDFDARSVIENNAGQIKMTANLIAEMYPKIKEDIDAVFAKIGKKRNEFFKPWSGNVPDSIAEGILDDTTYDGLEVVRGMIETGGLPLVADEESLQKAYDLAIQHTGIDLSATGSAGLAGLRMLVKNNLIQKGERCGLLFTGVGERSCDLPIINDRVFTLSADDNIKKLIG